MKEKAYDLQQMLIDLSEYGINMESLMDKKMREIEEIYNEIINKNNDFLVSFLDTPEFNDFIRHNLFFPDINLLIENTFGFTEDFCRKIKEYIIRDARFLFIPYPSDTEGLDDCEYLDQCKGYVKIAGNRNSPSYRNNNGDLYYYAGDLTFDKKKVSSFYKFHIYQDSNGKDFKCFNGIQGELQYFFDSKSECEDKIKWMFFLEIDSIAEYEKSSYYKLILSLLYDKYPQLKAVKEIESSYNSNKALKGGKTDKESFVSCNFHISVRVGESKYCLNMNLIDVITNNVDRIFEKNVWSYLSICNNYADTVRERIFYDSEGRSLFDIIWESPEFKKVLDCMSTFENLFPDDVKNLFLEIENAVQ